MKHWNIATCILVGMIAAACNRASVPTMTVIPTATDNLAAITTPEFTHTPILVSATSPTIEATPTIPPATFSVVSTIEAIVTEKPELERFYERHCIVYGFCCCVPNLGLSPDGKWAVFFNSPIDGSGGLSVVNVGSKKQWDISYYEITGTYGGDTTVGVEHWSQDGRYLYVSPRMAGSGGLGYFWRSETQLIRLDLTDGTWFNTNMSSAFSFSPDDRFIVYRREQNVVIHEFQTGQERIFAVPSEYGAFGRFVWSQDNKQIMFIGSSVEELEAVVLPDDAKGFTLFLLNTANMKAQVIIEKDQHYLYPLEWQVPNIVLLESLYKVGADGILHHNGEKYRLDLETNDISKHKSP
jgi:hypothetical protein